MIIGLKELLILSMASLSVTFLEILKSDKLKSKKIAEKILIGLIIPLTIIPYVAEYYNLSVKGAIFITVLTRYLFDEVMNVLKQQLPVIIKKYFK